MTHRQLGSNVHYHRANNQAAGCASALPLHSCGVSCCPLPRALHSCRAAATHGGGHRGQRALPAQRGEGSRQACSRGSVLGWGTNRNKPQDRLREGLRRGEGEGRKTRDWGVHLARAPGGSLTRSRLRAPQGHVGRREATCSRRRQHPRGPGAASWRKRPTCVSAWRTERQAGARRAPRLRSTTTGSLRERGPSRDLTSGARARFHPGDRSAGAISRTLRALWAVWQEQQPRTSTRPGLEVREATGSHRPQGSHECGQPPQGWRVLAGRAKLPSTQGGAMCQIQGEQRDQGGEEESERG